MPATQLHVQNRGFSSVLLIATVFAAAGCRDAPRDYRGPGLSVATLSVGDRVGVYRAALGGAFSIDDPTLSVLVDPLLLPRSAGLAGGDTLPAPVLSAMREGGLVKGTCTLPVTRARDPLVCQADRAGYVVRFSDPFSLGPDSVQVNLAVQQYATPFGNRAERLRFERAYHVRRQGSAWRAVREARMPQP